MRNMTDIIWLLSGMKITLGVCYTGGSQRIFKLGKETLPFSLVSSKFDSGYSKSAL